MPLVKKIHPDWFPKEKPDMKVGDTLEVSNVQALIDQGLAELTTEEKKEEPKEEVKPMGFKCEQCDFTTERKAALMSHARKHAKN